MGKQQNTCLTCKYEPYWGPTLRDPETREGQCQFYPNKKQIRAMGLPLGTQISPPWLRDNTVKTNCPAWTVKEDPSCA